jgi:hypothetical protein
MIDSLFMTCVKFLQWLGERTHLTYKEISVVFNLWVQGVVLLIASVAPLAVGIVKGCEIGVVPLAIYALACALMILKILRHYMMPMDAAFDQCVEDLQRIAMKWKRSYNYVNIAIFVVLYLLLLCFDGLLVYALL